MSIINDLKKDNSRLKLEINNKEQIRIFKLENKKLRRSNRYLYLQNRFFNTFRFANAIKETGKCFWVGSFFVLSSFYAFFIALATTSQ